MLARITNPTQGVGVATLTLEQLNQSSLNLFDGDDLFIQFIDGQGDLPQEWKNQTRGVHDSLGFVTLPGLEIAGAVGDLANIALSPEVINYLILSDQKTFRLRVKDASGTSEVIEECTVFDELYQSVEMKQAAEAASLAQEEEPKLAPEPPPFTSAPQEPLVNEASNKSYGGIVKYIVIGIIALAIIGAALYLALGILSGGDSSQPPAPPQEQTQEEKETPKEEPKEEASSPAPQEAQVQYIPCTIDQSMADSELLSKCMATKPNDATLLTFTQQALEAKKCDLAARIFISRGRSLSGSFAFDYAQYLDPNSSLSHECFKKDVDDAKYWYQKALEADPSNLKAKQALDALAGGQ